MDEVVFSHLNLRNESFNLGSIREQKPKFLEIVDLGFDQCIHYLKAALGSLPWIGIRERLAMLTPRLN